MSQIQLKKELQKLTKEQLIEQIAELYSMYKPVKEYFQTFLNQDNIFELHDKYKAIIVQEFFPKSKSQYPKSRFSVAKKAIADFAVLNPPPKLIADLMITLVENACQLTFKFGDMSEQFYQSTYKNFDKALKYMQKEGLLEDFRFHCEECIRYSESCGYGFTETMEELFDEYYQ
jgi:hypothetical protein